MRVLIIGGTVFLGRHLVEQALLRGHQVTLFNRGKTNPIRFDGVTQVHGDRDGELGRLGDQSFDVAIDTCGYLPRLVGESAAFLSDRVEHYTFISSVSVYDTYWPGINEDSPVETMVDPSSENLEVNSYGARKAACERAAEEAMPGRVLAIRPGLIVGKWDPSGRFTWWAHRVARGGEVLAPAPPERLVQVIDVVDLASWTLSLAERRVTGIFNASGPAQAFPMAAMLRQIKAVTDSDATFRWIDTEKLEALEVGHWMELPLWLPAEMQGMLEINIEQALSRGLTFRPFRETIVDALHEETPLPDNVGMEPEKESALLQK